MTTTLNHPTPLIASSIGMKPEDLADMVNYIKSRTNFEREELGWNQNRAYSGDSLFAKWAQYERQAEQDFKDRVVAGGLFADSNLSQNLPSTIASQHHDRITRDLLDSPKFFDLTPEGEEDAQLQAIIMSQQPPAMLPPQQPPAVVPGMPTPTAPVKPTETLMRVLHRESRVRNFASVLSKSVQSALYIGHDIIRPSYERKTVPRRVALSAWTVNGQTIRDSKGEMVMADRAWKHDPKQPREQAEIVLVDDPRIRLPAGTIVLPSQDKYGVNRPTVVSNGCNIGSVYWADFVIPATADWETADFRGHFYRATVDGIMSCYSKDDWTKEAYKYFRRHKNGELSRQQDTPTVTASEAVKERGEQETSTQNTASFLSNKAPHQRAYYEWSGNYDADGDGFAEPLHVVLDWDDNTVVRMEAANIVLPWLDTPCPHPYHNLTVFPVNKRWYGLSYYEAYKGWHEFIDLCWNRANLDIENSGNIFGSDSNAFVNPKDADNLGFRTNIVYGLMTGSRLSDAFQVQRVETQAAPVLEAMDRTIQKLQSHGGTMGASDPQTSALPATDTLGGLNKVLEQGDVFVSARERELVPTLNEVIRTLAAIKIHAIRQDPSQMISQVGAESGQSLMQFLQAMPGHAMEYLEVNLSKAFGTGQAQIGMSRIAVGEKWILIPSMYKVQYRPMFEGVLRGLGISDPKGYLDDPEAAIAMQQQIIAAQTGQPPPAAGAPQDKQTTPPQQ